MTAAMALSEVGTFSEVRAIRARIRREEGVPGGCEYVSEVLSTKFGWPIAGGCYHTEDGRHITHFWSLLPDGRIFDATADQFQDGSDVRVTSAGDLRYVVDCPDEGEDG